MLKTAGRWPPFFTADDGGPARQAARFSGDSLAMPKTALITGASRGIGREIARQLVERGWLVIVTARDPQQAASTAREIGAAMSAELDVIDPASVERARATVRERFDHLDGLVNNAGVAGEWGRSILDVPEEDIRRLLDTNTFGPLRVARAFWDLLEPGGRIVNISSGLGQLGDPSAMSPAYGLSKTALNAVTVQLALAGKPAGIAVNSVCPGWVRTKLGGPTAPRDVSEGADTPVWLIAEAPPDLTGKLLKDRQEIPW